MNGESLLSHVNERNFPKSEFQEISPDGFFKVQSITLIQILMIERMYGILEERQIKQVYE
jgi:hypothetical protein